MWLAILLSGEQGGEGWDGQVSKPPAELGVVKVTPGYSQNRGKPGREYVSVVGQALTRSS